MARRIKFLRKQLRRGEKDFDEVFKQEAIVSRELINTPRARKRLGKIAQKPLLDDPNQLRGKRIRPSMRFFPPLAIQIGIKRTKKKGK